MAWSHRKDAGNKNVQGNMLLETHFKKANRKAKDTLGGRFWKRCTEVKRAGLEDPCPG
jgi:hypothetical protein